VVHPHRPCHRGRPSGDGAGITRIGLGGAILFPQRRSEPGREQRPYPEAASTPTILVPWSGRTAPVGPTQQPAVTTLIVSSFLRTRPFVESHSQRSPIKSRVPGNRTLGTDEPYQSHTHEWTRATRVTLRGSGHPPPQNRTKGRPRRGRAQRASELAPYPFPYCGVRTPSSCPPERRGEGPRRRWRWGPAG
jgi:hypothetical protein